jgi:hypothetical protein
MGSAHCQRMGSARRWCGCGQLGTWGGHGLVGWVHQGSSVAIGFGCATYSKAGSESSIATIGSGVVDSVVTSIGGKCTVDSVAESIGGGGGVALRSPRSVPTSCSLTSIPSTPPSSTQQTRWLRQASSVATIGFIILCGDYAHWVLLGLSLIKILTR